MKKSSEQNATRGNADVVHQVLPTDVIKAPTPAKDDVNPPPRAARGDDDLMSKQQHQQSKK